MFVNVSIELYGYTLDDLGWCILDLWVFMQLFCVQVQEEDGMKGDDAKRGEDPKPKEPPSEQLSEPKKV